MASMRSPSVQERLRAAKAERVLKHAREQRLESLAKRRAMDDIETNVRTQLDYVYDIKPPTIKNFTPTKTHRTKRMKDKWSGHMKTAASHGRRISAAALLAEEKDNLLSLVRAKATAKTTAAVTAAAAAATTASNNANKELERKEQEAEKEEEESEDDYDDEYEEEDDFEDDDFEDDDFESENGSTKPNTRREDDTEETNETNEANVTTVTNATNATNGAVNREQELPPQIGERIEAMIERIGWTEWFEGVVLDIYSTTEPIQYNIKFDDGEVRKDVLLTEMKLIAGQRIPSSTNQTNDTNNTTSVAKEESSSATTERETETTSSNLSTSLSRMNSFASPTEDIKSALESVTLALNSQEDVPRHVVSRLLRATIKTEFNSERGKLLGERITTGKKEEEQQQQQQQKETTKEDKRRQKKKNKKKRNKKKRRNNNRT